MTKAMALEWLESANDDLMLVSSIIEQAELTHLAAFHSQQSVEKSLKAVLEFHNKTVPKKHDLLVLKDMVSDYFELDDEDMLETLNGLYIDSRYPGNLGLLPNGKPTIEDGKDFFEFAENVVQKIKKLITDG